MQPIFDYHTTYPWQPWHFIVSHCGHMELEHFCVLQYDMGCSAALLISLQLVVDFDYVSKFVCQIILDVGTVRKKENIYREIEY